MTNFFNYWNIVNLIHILIVAPLLIAIGTGNFPPQYNQWLLVLAGVVVLYHLYRMWHRSQLGREGMSQLDSFESSVRPRSSIGMCGLTGPSYGPTSYGGSAGVTPQMGYVDVKDTDGAHIVRVFDSAPGYSTPFLNVKVGETVRWINTGEQSHTVTDVDEQFNSGTMMPGDVYEIKFTTPGKYTYFDVDEYGWMRGQITVG